MRNLFLGCVGLILGFVGGAVVILLLLWLLGLAGFPQTPETQPVLLPNRPDVSITASASFGKEQLEQAIVQSGTATSATVAFASPNLVRITSPVTVNLLGQPLSVDATVIMVLAVQRGRIILTTQSVDAGGISVSPSAFASTLERMRALGEDQLNRQMQRALQGTQLQVIGIRVSPDSITVDLNAP